MCVKFDSFLVISDLSKAQPRSPILISRAVLTLPSIHVEFFGVARSRANVAAATFDVESLREVLSQISEQFPALAELCVEGGELAPGWLLNVNGSAFTRDLSSPLNDGDNVLLIPADAGG